MRLLDDVEGRIRVRVRDLRLVIEIDVVDDDELQRDGGRSAGICKRGTER